MLCGRSFNDVGQPIGEKQRLTEPVSCHTPSQELHPEHPRWQNRFIILELQRLFTTCFLRVGNVNKGAEKK